MTKRALITGITGQDGSYLAELLLEKGYEVHGMVRRSSEEKFERIGHLRGQIRLHQGDLLDQYSLASLLVSIQPAEVYNLAAQSFVPTSWNQPVLTGEFTALGVTKMLEAIRHTLPQTRFYQASSSEMFGLVRSLPVNETTPLHPLSPYAISKASGYWIGVNYRESYGVHCVNGVLFNHESYLRTSNYFIKKVIKTSLDIKNNLADKLSVGNIDVKRDFGFAPDYVQAMWLSLQQDKADDYLICSGKSIYLRDIISYIFDYVGISMDKLVEDPTLFRPTDIKDIYGDNTKAKTLLKWEYDKSFFDVLTILIEEEKSNYK